jgi:hypothetical protein
MTVFLGRSKSDKELYLAYNRETNTSSVVEH